MSKVRRFVRLPLAVLLGLALAAGLGCGGGGGSSEFSSGGVKVKVLHPNTGHASSKGKAQGDSSETVFDWGDPHRKPLTVILDHQKLTIDGTTYGEVKAGDEVVIDARRRDLRVTVGGVERKPAE